MERFKRGPLFWALMLVSIVLPALADAQTTTIKKEVWAAKILSPSGGVSRVGGATIIRTRTTTFHPDGTRTGVTEVRYSVSTSQYPCGIPCVPLVTKVSLTGPGAGATPVPYEITLCDGNCTYMVDSDPNINGNLLLNGTFDPVPTGGFMANLDQDSVAVLLNDGLLGFATFTRIQ